MNPTDASASAVSWLHQKLGRATEPYILFPAAALIVLGVIWVTTLNLIKVERIGAERAAAASSRELAETYEAQAVRALREIDQTLKLVKYSYESGNNRETLPELKKRALLPPDLLFSVSVANARGDIVASTRPGKFDNVYGQDYFEAQRNMDNLAVSRPLPGTDGGKLRFSRRLDATDGAFTGVVILAVDAAYFVSGYEAAKLGQRGVLGILGTDGIFRARRSGDTMSSGGAVDYAQTVPVTDTGETEAVLSVNAWDGVRRYTSARQLYDFPLAVIVGLSEDEQLAVAHRNTRTYLWRAGIGSLLLLLVAGALARMGWQLAQARQRAVEEQIAHAQRIEYLAYHDGLTGLPNRSLFSKLLIQSINQAHRYQRQLAVLFLDLDHFKHINDTLGHEAGDQLLQEVATRLSACLRESDTVARLGGDEFVVMLPELDEEKYIITVAQKILAGIARPFLLLGQEFRVTASIGISTYPSDGLDEQTLTKNADIAMYQAKQEGKNNFQFYSEKLNTESLERLNLESGLRRALENNEFELHYQAERDVKSGKVTGMEALLRWVHPDLGTVQPMKFIPIAEETGLIVPIGRWVIRTACQQNVAWQKQGLPHLSMAVNLTTRQFHDEHLLHDLTSILRETGMEASLLELEIAESLLVSNTEKSRRILGELKELGVKIAIDDFGIGYSSLSTLQRFPLDTIKIDRSFIRDIVNTTHDRELTDAIIELGKTLSLTVVAQGVETKEQADFLRDHSCDELQGFYFNKPVPADQFEELLRAQGTAAPEQTG